MKLVVGLGNPGASYESTRHNIGFDVLGELALRWRTDRPKSRFEANLIETNFGGEKVLLAAPQTYMNVSGRSVYQIVKYFQIPLTDVLVVCDDLNLKFGQLRLRATGSAGGQKGLLSILQVCATEDVARLRVGIGRPPGQMDVVNFVLSKFKKDELPVVDAAVRAAATGVELWIERGIAAAMNLVNAPVDDKDDDSSERKT